MAANKVARRRGARNARHSAGAGKGGYFLFMPVIIDFSKKFFTPFEADYIISRLEKARLKGVVEARFENNEHLICSYCGRGPVSEKWNVKIYKFNQKKRGHSLVTNDIDVIGKIVSGDLDFKAPDLAVLSIDDSGWGFPMCGVMLGVTDGVRIETSVVPVEFFQGERYEAKDYLVEYSRLGFDTIKKFGASNATHRIEICTGYVNRTLRDDLRRSGYHVSVTEIKGILQDGLEKRFREYVKAEISRDLYYDPKEIGAKAVPRRYAEALEFGRKFFPHKLKSGWSSIGAPDTPVSG